MRTKSEVLKQVEELTNALIQAHQAGWISLDTVEQVIVTANPLAQLELDLIKHVKDQ